MQRISEPSLTPWQKIHCKFGLSQSALARALGCHRSKISRAISDGKGLINGRDQEAILKAAEEKGVRLTASDMVSGV